MSIAEKIMEWQGKNGESFVDCFEGNLKASTFMTWCYGKGYLTRYQYNKWMELYLADNYKADCANYFVSNYGDPDNDWAVVQFNENGDCDDENFEEEARILGEFIEGVDLYKKRFYNFLGY